MIDTHTHIYNDNDGGEGALQRAIASGVSQMIFPNVDIESVEPIKALHEAYPYNTHTAMGLHPTEIGNDWKKTLRSIERQWGGAPIVAIGEIGIDLYWDKSKGVEQREAFAYQLEMARERKLPVIIHSRDAMQSTLDVLLHHADRHGDIPPIVFHSFTGTKEEAVKALEYFPAARFGFNGVATYKNASDVRAAMKYIGINRIVLETDSPYLTPVPLRGKRNESAYIIHVLHSVADTLGLSPQEVEIITDQNARKLFNIKQ